MGGLVSDFTEHILCHSVPCSVGYLGFLHYSSVAHKTKLFHDICELRATASSYSQILQMRPSSVGSSRPLMNQ